MEFGGIFENDREFRKLKIVFGLTFLFFAKLGSIPHSAKLDKSAKSLLPKPNLTIHRINLNYSIYGFQRVKIFAMSHLTSENFYN